MLLAAMESGQAGRGEARLPRAPWAARVLVEQLFAVLPEGDTRDILLPLFDPVQGVTNRKVAPVIRQLTADSKIAPTGVGNNAKWIITEVGCEASVIFRSTLPGNDGNAVRLASQRAMAIFVAWSKTALA